MITNYRFKSLFYKSGVRVLNERNKKEESSIFYSWFILKLIN